MSEVYIRFIQQFTKKMDNDTIFFIKLSTLFDGFLDFSNSAYHKNICLFERSIARIDGIQINDYSLVMMNINLIRKFIKKNYFMRRTSF